MDYIDLIQWFDVQWNPVNPTTDPSMINTLITDMFPQNNANISR